MINVHAYCELAAVAFLDKGISVVAHGTHAYPIWVVPSFSFDDHSNGSFDSKNSDLFAGPPLFLSMFNQLVQYNRYPNS